MNKQVVSWSVEDTGIENSQFHQGYGVAYTQWDAVFMGAGDNFEEAFEDAIGNCSSAGYDLEIPQDEFDKEVESSGSKAVSEGDYNEDCWYYVGLFVKVK